MALGKGVPIEQMGDREALDQIRVDSVIWPLPLLESRLFRMVVRAARLLAVKEFINEEGVQDLVVRNLAANDLARANRQWREQTSGTVNAWENSQIANNAVAASTFVAVFGVADLGNQGSVGAIRLTVGGSQVREWDLQAGFNPNAAARSYVDLARYYVSLSPVVISPQINVTMEFYPRGATNTDALPSELVVLGIVVERVGGTGGLSA